MTSQNLHAPIINYIFKTKLTYTMTYKVRKTWPRSQRKGDMQEDTHMKQRSPLKCLYLVEVQIKRCRIIQRKMVK